MYESFLYSMKMWDKLMIWGLEQSKRDLYSLKQSSCGEPCEQAWESGLENIEVGCVRERKKENDFLKIPASII